MKLRILIFSIILLFSCEKFDLRDDISAENYIELNAIQKIIITRDNGLLIAGIYDSKLTIIKTDANFKTIWRRDNFEWGTQMAGNWGSSMYGTNVVNVFEDESGNFLLIISVVQGGDVIESSAMLIELSDKGKEMEKVEFKDIAIYDAARSSDGGLLIWGSKVLKLNKSLKKSWEQDYWSRNETWVGKIINTNDGRYALTSWNFNDESFLKILEPDGNESKSEKYSFRQNPFDENGYDLIQADDQGFVIAGRTRKLTEPWDMDCGVTRIDLSGTKTWTTIFGGGSEEWLEDIIYSSGTDIIIQGKQGYPGNPVQKTILVKMDWDGHILDSCRVARIEPLLYHPHDYFVEVYFADGGMAHFRKIPFDKLFAHYIPDI